MAVDGYLDVPPKFRGEDFLGIVSDEIERREAEVKRKGGPFRSVVITDIGYGTGRFLLQIL